MKYTVKSSRLGRRTVAKPGLQMRPLPAPAKARQTNTAVKTGLPVRPSAAAPNTRSTQNTRPPSVPYAAHAESFKLTG